MTSGYSGTPLPKKLGIKSGTRLAARAIAALRNDRFGAAAPVPATDVHLFATKAHFREFAAAHALVPSSGRDLGAYDPMVKNKDNRVSLKPDRIKYWMSIGALPSEKVQALLDKHLKKAEEAASQAAAAPAPPPS